MIALVTGAGRGIGRAVALALGDAGMRVALCSRTRSDVEAVAAQIRGKGGEADAHACDVASADEVMALAQAVEPPDVLVCNAGTGTVAPVEVADYDIAEWDRILAVNLRGVFLTCRAFLPGMRARGRGTIILIGSIAGRRAAPYVAPYDVAKFGVAGLAEALRAENHQHGIRVSLVTPGPTNTSIWDLKKTPLTAETRAAMMKPEDVAYTVAFLAQLPWSMRIDELTVLPPEFPLKLWDYRIT
jgi:NAD(P)-dependent dehydrogenase (short-subunit alcohol dehydrogenase family)